MTIDEFTQKARLIPKPNDDGSWLGKYLYDDPHTENGEVLYSYITTEYGDDVIYNGYHIVNVLGYLKGKDYVDLGLGLEVEED